jgi:hypothetical protein
MSPELDKQLCEKYPKIFKNRHGDMKETCMCWGLEIGDGWYNLIDHLCCAATYTYSTSLQIDEEDGKRLGIEPYTWKGEEKPHYSFEVKPPQMVADQVKEKFGTLRFYHHLEFDPVLVELEKSGKYPDIKKVMDRYCDYIDGMVHMAESMSGRTCEVTGKEGEMHVSGGSRNGWYKVLNREVAKTDPFYVDRGYVPSSDLLQKKSDE